MKKIFLILFLLSVAPASANEPVVAISMIKDSADAVVSKKVVERAYQQLGISVAFEAYSATEALAASNGGEVSAELARVDGLGLEFENLVKVPVPINIIQGAAFSSNYRFPVSGWHSLRPYRIGIVKGVVFSDQQTVNMDRMVFDGYPQLIQAIESDTVDVGVMPRVQALHTMRLMGIETIAEMDGILETLLLYHYVHVSRRDLVDQLTSVLKEMLLSGETRRIRDETLKAMLEKE